MHKGYREESWGSGWLSQLKIRGTIINGHSIGLLVMVISKDLKQEEMRNIT